MKKFDAFVNLFLTGRNAGWLPKGLACSNENGFNCYFSKN